MLKAFTPDEQLDSVFELRAERLKEQGFKGVITDLDNTLVQWDEPLATERVIEWLEEMEANGIRVTIVSNNNENRVNTFCQPHGVKYVSKAIKPSRRAFKESLKLMDLKKEEVVVVGDQLLTDIFGGNRAGLYTILVNPLVQTDALITRFNRFTERRILNRLKKRGLIRREK